MQAPKKGGKLAAAPAKKKPVCIFFGVPCLSKKHLYIIFCGVASVLTFCIFALILVSRRRF